MPYIHHTTAEKEEMLNAIGAKAVEELFSDVPESLMEKDEFILRDGLSEMETAKMISEIAAKNNNAPISFLGGGFYNHYIPKHVINLATRSEFFTAYTPYQPETSQGVLQAIFEYQTMITRLTGHAVTNASMYDGSSATGEACLMASDITRRKKILVGRNLHPQYREVMQTYCDGKDLTMEEVPFDTETGQIDKSKLEMVLGEEIAGVFVQSPNFFGVVEDVKEITEMAHKCGALSVQVVTEALSLGALPTPEENEVDIAVGEGQSFGIPISGGGPGFGFFSCSKKHIRRLPGRISGETVDAEGNKAYVLTLQAREQHIRREKAGSNICTNQTLFALFGLIYLASMGKKLGDLAMLNHTNAVHFSKELTKKGWSRMFSAPFFNEFVVDADSSVVRKIKEDGICAGLDLSKLYPELEGKLLVAVTEMNSESDMESYLSHL